MEGILLYHLCEKKNSALFKGGYTIRFCFKLITRFVLQVIKRLTPVGVDCFLTQLLELGFFHADPHPGKRSLEIRSQELILLWSFLHDMNAMLLNIGNILVTPDGKLALIDFGLCAKVPVCTFRNSIELWFARAIETSKKTWLCLSVRFRFSECWSVENHFLAFSRRGNACFIPGLVLPLLFNAKLSVFR